MEHLSEGAGLIILAIIMVVSILWILVPFLIMGVNNRLDKLIRHLEDLKNIAHTKNKYGEDV